MLAYLLVTARGFINRLTGGDRTGLTLPCRGCSDPGPHDAHLAPGALKYLSR